MGIAPADRVRLADGRALARCVADGRALARCVADRLALGVLDVPVGLGEMVADAEAVAPGDKLGKVAWDDPVQPATAAAASMAAKPAATSLAVDPVPAVLVRIFTGLLIPAADDGPVHTSMTAGTGREIAVRLARGCAGGRQLPGSADGDYGKPPAIK